MLLPLYLNGIELSYEDDDLIDIIVRFSSGEADEDDLREWIKAHIK